MRAGAGSWGLSVGDRVPLCQAPAALLGRTGHAFRSRGRLAPRDVKEHASCGAMLHMDAGRLAGVRVGGRNEEGARAPNDRHPSVKFGSLSAPACGGSPCRGCDHIVSVLLVPPYGVQTPGLRIRTVGGCAPRRTMRSAAARRASVQCVATPAQPRVHGPGICGELHPRGRRMIAKSALPQPGHRPCPASDAQLLRPSDRARMGGVWEAGAGISENAASRLSHPAFRCCQDPISAWRGPPSCPPSLACQLPHRLSSVPGILPAVPGHALPHPRVYAAPCRSAAANR